MFDRNVLLGFLSGAVAAGAVTFGVVSAPQPATILSNHARLAIIACNELKLENESIKTEYDGSTDKYEIISQCSNGIVIHLTVPRKQIPSKEV